MTLHAELSAAKTTSENLTQKVSELEQQHRLTMSEVNNDRDRLSEELAQNRAACSELTDMVEMERSTVNELKEQNSLLSQSLEETRTSAAADQSRLQELQETVKAVSYTHLTLPTIYSV